VQNVVLAIRSLTRDSDLGDESSDPAVVVPFLAEGNSMPELIQRLVDDVLASIGDSPNEVADVELANVLKTDEGWRAWGYLRFSTLSRIGPPPSITVGPAEGTTAGRAQDIRLILTSESPILPGALRSDTTDGTFG